MLSRLPAVRSAPGLPLRPPSRPCLSLCADPEWATLALASDLMMSGERGMQMSESLIQSLLGEPGRVLVVDDEAPNRELLRDVLQAEGHDVEEACDGHEAFRR